MSGSEWSTKVWAVQSDIDRAAREWIDVDRVRTPNPHRDPGFVAALRRLTIDDPGDEAFWRVVLRHGLLGERAPRIEHQRWITLLSAFAMLAEVRDDAAPLGEALYEAGVSEPRLVRLLRAHDASLWTAVRQVAHAMRSKAVRPRADHLADLVLSDGWDADRREDVRRGIASAYYRAEHEKKKHNEGVAP